MLSSRSTTTTRATENRINRINRMHLMLVLFCGTLSLLLSPVHAERDFNTNDSQVPLVQPETEVAYKLDPYVAELQNCTVEGANPLLLSLVFRNWRNKYYAIEKLSKFFAIPKEYITADTVHKSQMYAMFKESKIRRNASKKSYPNHAVNRVSFVIGCGSDYFSMGAPIANQIGQQVKDNSLNGIVKGQIGWWFIWQDKHKTRKPRNRRDTEASGDDDDDYDYGDDDEEPIEATTLPQSHAHRHHHGSAEQQQSSSSSSTTIQSLDNNDLSSSTQMTSTATTMATSTTEASSAVSMPDAISSSSSSTTAEPVESRLENQAPIIKTRLQKLAVTSGKAFSFHVPDDTFEDNEDQHKLRLRLTDKDGNELKPTSWLQFNADKRELYGLALDDAVSRWQYQLTATDSTNQSVTETVEISVQQHRGVRAVNHEIGIEVRINDKEVHNIDWQLQLLQAITKTLGDATNSSIVVREIRTKFGDASTATLVYYNETLLGSSCPSLEIKELAQRLDTLALNKLVEPTLSVKSVTGELTELCRKADATSNARPTTPPAKNRPPVLRNQVDRVNATAGSLLVYKVPSDTFYDPNDSELTLTLKTKDLKDLSPRHWLQFDSKNQEFYGVPMNNNAGREEYLLVAEDSAGLTATDAIIVVVNNFPKRDFSIAFKAQLGVRHDLFHADLQRKFVERIAQLHGDADTSNILVRYISISHENDMTYVTFYNTTLHKTNHRCPEAEIAATHNVYFKSENVLRERVKKALGTELNLQNLTESRYGSCHQQIDITHHEFPQAKPEEPTLKSAFSEDFLITFVLPAAIIIVMILLAILIACCLHRRRHKSGKMELGDEEERRSFRTKGIPVIFQDELDEKPEIGNKSPIILKDEKPPLLPPSYNTSNMNGDNDVDEYVPPPAVVIGGREARGKSPATPSYRKPPPYVSP